MSFASSSDGTILVGCVPQGDIYVSTDSGVTWAGRSVSSNWQGVTSSADGYTMSAVGYGDYVYTSV